MNKAVIFDLDGTLWQVIDETVVSANYIAKKYNQPQISKQTVCNVFGKNRVDASKLYFPTLETEIALKYTEEIEHYNNEYLLKNGGTLYDGVEEKIIKLSKTYKLFIVSNTAEQAYIQAFLINSKLSEYFSGYIASGGTFKNMESAQAKGEGIKKIIKENSIDKAVYVGDTYIDLMASKYASVPFIWAKYGFANDLEAKYSMERFSDVISVVNNVI